ncbi:MAG: gamma-glutamyltransferase [Colwellia sp.]|nr:gamma-glutamyltransferase [Colwellia sp.]MCW9082593.1 gamma-glutamyltransferase [Colwellia sp.]
MKLPSFRTLFPAVTLCLSTTLLLTACEQQKTATRLPAKAAVLDIDRVVNYYDINHPVIGRKGMVVSQSEIASNIGAEILQRGGNAVDAAVAVGFALAVVLPRAGNLTGGGFMLVHLQELNKTIAIDYREMAPLAAVEHMFIDSKGDVDNDKALETLAAAGVPGTVAGFEYALENYGTMTLKQLIKPALEIAQQGFVVNDDMVRIVKKTQTLLQQNNETCRVFFKQGCQPYQTGELFKQPDLATTLQYLSEEGADGFYQGDIAKKIVLAMEQGQGLITIEDLRRYQVKELAPIKGHFNGYEILTMPPPSSGGVHLVQMLNMLEQLPIENIAQGSASMMHLQTEIFKRAYVDRSKHLGDPDFVDVPAKGIVSKTYAKKLSQHISHEKITPSSQIKPGEPSGYESPDTTHFSVIDKQGNIVSNTYTLNHYYGSGITIPGTGLLMNNTMDDFSAKVGSPNSYGLVGGKANAIVAQKRPLSSMTPTIVLKSGQPFLATGTPGGSKIITSVFQQLVNILWFDMNVSEATNAPRIHHQWQPDILYVEQNVAADSIALLQQMGYQIELSTSLGSLQTIMLKDGIYYGAADPRRPNAKAVAVN